MRLDGVEGTVPEVRRRAAELRVPLARGDLQVAPGDPLRQPAQPAVAHQEAAPETQAAERRVEVADDPLGDRAQRVAVHGQQRQRRRPRERVTWQLRQQVKADIQDLNKQHFYSKLL